MHLDFWLWLYLNSPTKHAQCRLRAAQLENDPDSARGFRSIFRFPAAADIVVPFSTCFSKAASHSQALRELSIDFFSPEASRLHLASTSVDHEQRFVSIVAFALPVRKQSVVVEPPERSYDGRATFFAQ